MVDVDVAYLDPKSWDDEMPARTRWLRENDPLYWSERDQLWIATRYDDVAHVSKNQDLFTSAHGVRPANSAKIGLIDEAEPRHGRLRSLINRGFTPRMVKKLEAIFRGITTEALDAIAGQGECDFVEAVSVPLPILLIAEMLGIRREDRARFHHWSDDMIRGDGGQFDPERMAAAGRAFAEYAAYVREIIEDRRRNPQDDLVSVLVGAKDQGVLATFDQRLPEEMGGEHLELANDELIMLLVILLVAGNETTRNGISGGMQLLIENPGERRKLLDDPALLPSAVEEMVRLVSPVHSFARTVVRDLELRGKALRAGQKVLMLYGSANRDAEVFPDPDAFRVERNPHHLGFGLGPHFCLGANLARREMRVAFEELLRRLPDMRYADGERPVVGGSAIVRSCVRMRVRYTPEQPREDRAA
jgi:cytochrome P450 family 142 subfamily A polypeptide 1